MPKKKLEMTKDEAREKLILHFWMLVEYWENESRQPNTRDKLEGLLHSILATLDGCSGMMPGFTVAARVPKGDIEFHEERESRYFPPDKDIGGYLHEIMYQVARKHGKIS